MLVRGCVYGAWWRLEAELGEQAPSLEWCAATFEPIKRQAPAPGPGLLEWTLAELRRRWLEAEPALEG